jgi:PadR family transcriptional regulator, regulatory protein PadR
MSDNHLELVQGTLEMLVLKTRALAAMHGWGIAHRIERMSKDVFLVAQGSLYPALVRMKRQDWRTSSWRVTDNGRRARYYELTVAGRRLAHGWHAERGEETWRDGPTDCCSRDDGTEVETSVRRRNVWLPSDGSPPRHVRRAASDRELS